MVTYLYRSKVGLFRIYPWNGRCALEIEGEIYGSYHSPVAAADDVYLHETGYDPWDLRPDGPNDPPDLSEWEVFRI